MSRTHSRWYLGTILLCFVAQPTLGITLQVDYTYDSSNFFGAGNPQGAAAGAQARASLEAAASFYNSILTDTFDAITVPPPYHSSVPGSTSEVIWSWNASFPHPSNDTQWAIGNLPISKDQYIIYAGAKSFADMSRGQGVPGGSLTGLLTPTINSFSAADLDNINSISTSFGHAVNARGQSSGFVRWGGSISFDNDGSTPWFFDHLASPADGTIDFYSAALQELAQAIGFGERRPVFSISGEIDTIVWPTLIGSGPAPPWVGTGLMEAFVGANAKALNGGNPVALYPDEAHWYPGYTSVVYGTPVPQEAAMVPNLPTGTRKLLTEFDVAALKDLGWSIGSVPEPTAGILSLMVGIIAYFSRNKFRR